MAEGGDQGAAVEVAVAALAGGLGGEQAGVAGRAVEGVALAVGVVVGAEGVGGAELHGGHGSLEVPGELLGISGAPFGRKATALAVAYNDGAAVAKPARVRDVAQTKGRDLSR